MTSFHTLFRIAMKHDYYESGYAPDMKLMPVPATATLLRNGRMLLRHLPAGYAVVVQRLGNGDAVVEMDAGQRFIFALSGDQPNRLLSFTELDERTITAVNPADNRALGQTVTVSSSKNASTGGEKAVDGNNNTAWESAETDDQWIMVDLGALFHCTDLTIQWKKKAQVFEVQVSPDAATWITIERLTGNNANSNHLSGLSVTGRFIRVRCVESNNGQGFGIRELSVLADEQWEVIPYASGKVLYFTNNPADASNDPGQPEVVTHTLIDKVVPESFVFAYAEASLADTMVEATAPGGTTFKLTGPDALPAVIKPGADGIYRHPVSLRNKAEGLYTFTIKTADEVTVLASKKLYFHEDLSRQSLLGIVDIEYAAAQANLYGPAEYFDLQFDRKETHWNYVVVNKSGQIDFADAELEIDDQSGDAGDPYAVYEFAKGAVVESDPELNGLDSLSFYSKRPIPLFEEPKLHLELKDVSAPNPVIVPHLSNPPIPGIHHVESKIYVFV